MAFGPRLFRPVKTNGSRSGRFTVGLGLLVSNYLWICDAKSLLTKGVPSYNHPSTARRGSFGRGNAETEQHTSDSGRNRRERQVALRPDLEPVDIRLSGCGGSVALPDRMWGGWF